MKTYPMMFTGKDVNGDPHQVRKLGEIDFYADDNFVKDAERRGIALCLNGQQFSWALSLHKNFTDLVSYLQWSNAKHIPDFYCALDLATGPIVKKACVCTKDVWLHNGCQCGGA